MFEGGLTIADRTCGSSLDANDDANEFVAYVHARVGRIGVHRQVLARFDVLKPAQREDVWDE
ncbi:hypothetical protein HUG10_11015 [Halorarum halophilum]|uniref:Uncharacterized protein n=1 Tax=Halorarum halophilum TaxID=2743090 RepID=A0A7D5GC83_9EURY|nr:hypothetical protein [Halobaculum halophilum]QLG28052.1 hypothetical protein HUG10_11015 [Halobaculum halophilum]